MKKQIKKKIISKKDETEEYKIAYDFALKAYQNFKEIIKSIVFFGSAAQEKQVKGSDIDLVIIVDDCTVQWDQELISWYREELGKLIAKQPYKDKLHVNTVTLSVFWEEIKAGEPVAINVLRYGKPLIDFGGFFEPLKILLAKGRIKPTPESVFTTLQRAPLHLTRAHLSIVGAVDGLYWAMVDSAHAALMAANQTPPSPEHIADLLTDVFVKKKKLDKRYVGWYQEMFELSKGISHGVIKDIRGADVDKHTVKVNMFVSEMTKITKSLIEKEKIIRLVPKE